MFTVYILYLLTFLFFVSHGEICTDENCLLPSCQCSMNDGDSLTLNINDLPQFILFTFVGNLNENTIEPLQLIFNSSYRNPNKCRISSTFFVHDIYTNYCSVQRLFDNQHEIAMTAASNRCPLKNCFDENNWHRWTNDDWEHEIKQQRINLVRRAQIDSSHIKGFRVPHLQIDENKHFEYLKNNNFHYDSSMLFKSTNLMWPFTLNYEFDQTDCINCQKWTKAFPGLWQFPLHEWTYPNSIKTCRTLSDSSCLPGNEPHSSDIYFNFLMHNFERYTKHRIPFVIQLDLSWLTENKNEHLKSIINFIETILKNPQYRYVYFISIEKALEWYKYPRSLDNLHDFWAFSCHDKIYSYDTNCSNIALNENDFENIFSDENMKTSELNDLEIYERQAEKLFPTTATLHTLWITVLLLLIVLFYDKYFTNK